MYAFDVTINQPMDQAVDTVIAALADENYGVVSDVNVSGIFKKKLDVDYGGYRILGACKAPLAKQVLDADPNAGALLPCNVVVRESGENQTTVAFLDPVFIMSHSGTDAATQVGATAKQELLRVKDALARL